jgi:photosystem II stability/assembly factor-like uncharacterized protein
MKPKTNTLFLISTLLCIFFSAQNAFSQWEKVYANSVWANSSVIYSHKNVLFQVGFSNGSYQTLRSSDNGISWTDITSSFPDDNVYHMLSFGNTVYALTDLLGGANDYYFYASTDDGVTWSEKSRIDRGSGNGAILSLASDGNNLFAITNRRSFYKSTDGGSTWAETVINYTGTSAIISFAASGNTYLAVLQGVGAILSTDGGLSWTLKNSTNTIARVYKINNDIWGFAGFDGIYKYNLTTNTWEDNYLPGSFYTPISIASNGTQLISSFSGFLTGDTRYFSSNNNGTSWSELTTEIIGAGNKILSPYTLAINSSYYFASYWKFVNKVISAEVYRLSLNSSPLSSKTFENNTKFHLKNYPNPFNQTTTISFSIPISGNVSLKIFNILGQEIDELINENLATGSYSFQWNAEKQASGVYFYKLISDSYSESKKMILYR